MKKLALGACACVFLGVAAGAGMSTWYWGYPFARPAIPEVTKATAVLSLTWLRAVERDAGCTLEMEALPDLRGHAERRRRYSGELPWTRPLFELERRGLLPEAAQPPAWLDAPTVYGSVRNTGVLVKGEPGYDTHGCFHGYLLELGMEGGATRVLVSAGGPQVSNDHHPAYEVAFRREGDRLALDRKRVTYYDVAGMEGAEWPILHAAFVLLSALVVAAVAWAARRSAAGLDEALSQPDEQA